MDCVAISAPEGALAAGVVRFGLPFWRAINSPNGSDAEAGADDGLEAAAVPVAACKRSLISVSKGSAACFG